MASYIFFHLVIFSFFFLQKIITIFSKNRRKPILRAYDDFLRERGGLIPNFVLWGNFFEKDQSFLRKRQIAVFEDHGSWYV